MKKVSQVSKQIDASPTWIRDNTAEFAAFLSPTAAPPKGTVRRYDDHDVAILATVKRLKAEGEDSKAIEAALDAGDIDRPPMAVEMAQESQKADVAIVAQAQAEIAQYKGELTATKAERDRLVADLTAERQARIAAEREAAGLAAKLEQYEQQAVISVVHSVETQKGREMASEQAKSARPWWQFWK
jgi:DNA-binding transcriptional MerR regulator